MMRLCAAMPATALLACFTALGTAAQAPPTDPASAKNPPVPTIWFQVEWLEADPTRYAVAVDSTGRAAYTSVGKEAATGDGDAYTIEFTMSAANVKMVFAAAERVRFFDGSFAYKKRIAFTGNKRLTYADARRRYSTTFNYSENPDVSALTRLFQGVSTTAEFDRRLQFMMRYNKLGLYDELKHMLEAVNDGWLAELQIVAPRLRAIANDNSVMHVARVKARQILAKTGITSIP